MSPPAVDLIASRLAKDVWNEELRAQLRLELQRSNDAALLRKLADTHYPEPNVAIPVLVRLVEIEPKDSDAMVRIAEMYAMHGEAAPARAWASRALGLDSNNANALYTIAQTHGGTQRETYADRILAINSHHFGAIREKVDALLRRGQRKAAEAIITSYVSWLEEQAGTAPATINAARTVLRRTRDA